MTGMSVARRMLIEKGAVGVVVAVAAAAAGCAK